MYEIVEGDCTLAEALVSTNPAIIREGFQTLYGQIGFETIVPEPSVWDYGRLLELRQKALYPVYYAAKEFRQKTKHELDGGAIGLNHPDVAFANIAHAIFGVKDWIFMTDHPEIDSPDWEEINKGLEQQLEGHCFYPGAFTHFFLYYAYVQRAYPEALQKAHYLALPGSRDINNNGLCLTLKVDATGYKRVPIQGVADNRDVHALCFATI